MPTEGNAEADHRGPRHQRARYVLVPDSSGILVRARSNIGPIDFAIVGISGYLEAQPGVGAFQMEPQPRSELTLDLRSLTSGKAVYDAELARRLDLRTYPLSTITLSETTRLSGTGRYSVRGELTLHGVTRMMDGAVSAVLDDNGCCSVSGEQVFDIRDFQIETPQMLMLRIFPDVRVSMSVTFQHQAP